MGRKFFCNGYPLTRYYRDVIFFSVNFLLTDPVHMPIANKIQLLLWSLEINCWKAEFDGINGHEKKSPRSTKLMTPISCSWWTPTSSMSKSKITKPKSFDIYAFKWVKMKEFIGKIKTIKQETENSFLYGCW